MLALLLLLWSLQLLHHLGRRKCRKIEWAKEETGWPSFLPECWHSVKFCCLAHPLMPWNWEKLSLSWFSSRPILCLVNSYTICYKLIAREMLGLCHSIPGTHLAKVRTKVKRKWWNLLSGQHAIISPRRTSFLGRTCGFDCAYVIDCICKWHSHSHKCLKGEVLAISGLCLKLFRAFLQFITHSFQIKSLKSLW